MGDLERRILDKLDDLYERQTQMNVILARQEVHLQEHIARTDALEALVQLHYDELHDEIRPVKDHVTMLKGASKVGAVLLSVAGLIIGLLKVLL